MSANKYQKIEKLFKGYVTLATSFLLALFVTSTFFPVLPSGAITCEDGSTGTAGEHCDTSGTGVSVNIENPYHINIASSVSKIDLDYTAEDSPNLGNLLTAAATVTTSSNTGQMKHLYISTASDSNNLTNSETDLDNNKTYIGAGGGNTLDAATNLSDNTWGFNILDNNTFTKVPTLGNEILLQEEVGTENTETGEYESTQNVTYGVLATTDLYAGSYSNTIRYTAFTTEPPDTPETPDMQDFTITECNQLTQATASNYDEVKITLRDSRDDKEYAVVRMKDGNCWMSTNLALDGTDTNGDIRTLTTKDSNVKQDRPLAREVALGTEAVDTTIQIYSGIANDTTTNCEEYLYCVITDAPYGNLYNFMAATAGTGVATADETTVITEDICPKNWHLPDDTGTGSWENLLSIYNLPTVNGTFDGEGTKAIQKAPFYLPLSGHYGNGGGITPGRLVNQGIAVRYWSRTIGGVDFAHALLFSASNGYFYPHNGRAKFLGQPVRCILGE